MSKRKSQDNNKSTPAVKKMAGQQSENSASSKEKLFVYRQDQVDAKSFYLGKKLADVHFTFDSDDGAVTRIPAHRILLALTSDVFEKMFCGKLKENGDVKIVDASEAAFREFLQFFYTNEVKLSAEHLASILCLGNKYNVEKCIDACGKFLAETLSNENVCAALSLAVLHKQEDLTELCEKRIMLNTADVFESAGFLDCSKEALAHILKMNLLSCSEVEVFEACMQWVRAKSKQQFLSKAMVEAHLGDLFYEIRFTSMTTKEFVALETKYSAVLSTDFKAIIRLIDGADIRSEQFNTSPRQVKWNEDEDAMIGCDRDHVESSIKWYTLDNEEKITFSTNKPFVLGEFKCDGIYFDERNPEKLEADLSVEVNITEARTLDDATDAKVLCSMTANLGSDWTTVSLPHPILIRPKFFYTIRMKGFPRGHCFTSLHQKSSMKLGPNKIEFHNDKENIDGKIFGLIFGMYFNEV